MRGASRLVLARFFSFFVQSELYSISLSENLHSEFIQLDGIQNRLSIFEYFIDVLRYGLVIYRQNNVSPDDDLLLLDHYWYRPGTQTDSVPKRVVGYAKKRKLNTKAVLTVRER